MTKDCGVYKITNIITSDFYIGSANNIKYRFSQHRRTLSNNTHRNRHLQRAWNKYGGQAFEFSVILLCDVDDKLYYEQVLLNALKPAYNISTCAEAVFQGRHHTKETKRKMSEAHKGALNHNFGTHLSEEAKRNLSEINKGKPNCMFGKHHTEETKHKMSKAWKTRAPMSEETKRKISDGNKNSRLSEEVRLEMSLVMMGELNPNFGKHRSEETKQKMREAQKRRWEKRKTNECIK